MVMLTFCFSALEVVVADVHDGDANGAQATVLEQSAPEGPASGTVPESGSSNHMHVCHCVHAHGGIVPTAQQAAAELRSRATLPLSAMVEPTAVDIDVLVRPPIA